MRVLIFNTAGYGYDARKYKEKLEGFKYEEVEREDFFYEEIYDRKAVKTYIEINSLDDLKELSEAVDKELVVDFRKSNKNFNDEPFIEIYDDYRGNKYEKEN